MKFRLLNILLIALFQIGWIGHHAVPTLTASRDMLAASSDTHDVGTPSKIWRNGYFRFLDLTTTLKPETSKASQEMIFASTDGHVYRMNGLGNARQLDGKVGTTLLHLNSSFLDSASSDRVFVSADNANVTGAQYKFGNGSLAFDGTGDYISTGDSPDWNFGTGDFTVDLWVRFNTVDNAVFLSQFDNANNFSYFSYNDTSNVLAMGWDKASTIAQMQAPFSPSSNTWYHIAFVRSSNLPYIFADGVSLTVTTIAGNANYEFPNLSDTLNVSIFVGGQYLDGWIDELRISKGIARWTSNFTPETKEY